MPPRRTFVAAQRAGWKSTVACLIPSPPHPLVTLRRTDFVRNDQLLSWISTHPKSSAGSSAAASGSGAAGSGTPGATAGGLSDASRSGTVLALTDPLQEATATGIGSAEAPAAAAAAAAVPAAAAAAGGHARQASRSGRAASTPMSGRLLDISRFEVPFFHLKVSFKWTCGPAVVLPASWAPVHRGGIPGARLKVPPLRAASRR